MVVVVVVPVVTTAVALVPKSVAERIPESTKTTRFWLSTVLSDANGIASAKLRALEMSS